MINSSRLRIEDTARKMRIVLYCTYYDVDNTEGELGQYTPLSRFMLTKIQV